MDLQLWLSKDYKLQRAISLTAKNRVGAVSICVWRKFNGMSLGIATSTTLGLADIIVNFVHDNI